MEVSVPHGRSFWGYDFMELRRLLIVHNRYKWTCFLFHSVSIQFEYLQEVIIRLLQVVEWMVTARILVSGGHKHSFLGPVSHFKNGLNCTGNKWKNQFNLQT
jgi:hypothetical protein